MHRLLLLTATTLLLTACKEGWTEEHRQAYLQSCGPMPGMTATQSDQYCRCMLDSTMQHYHNIDEVIANKDSAAMAAARQSCSSLVQAP